MNDQQYPIGQAELRPSYSHEERIALVESLARLPADFRAAFDGLDDARLDTPYRDGGWTLRQVAHHVPDSHMNAFVRMKLALTEDTPTIRPYMEDRWARLPDARLPVDVSLRILDALHERWAKLLAALSDADWRRAFVHPDLHAQHAAEAAAGGGTVAREEWGRMPLDRALASYEWHGRHHTAHVTALRDRMGW
jgi:hypothetical protein